MAEVKLSREVGVILLLFYGLGNILGAGIYVLVGKVAGIAGYFSVLSFLLACVIALFTALSYMELASRYPVSAGEAVYVQEGLGSRPLSIAFGLLIATAGLVSAATIAHGFAGYLGQFMQINKEVSILLLIVLLVSISIASIKVSVVIASLMTVLEIAGLLMIIYYGSDKITTPTIAMSAFVPQFTLADISVIVMGAFLAFYAFIGFEDMVNIAEEVKEPSKTFPIAIILALGISTLLYILIVIVSLETLSIEELQSSQAPFADIYTKLTGKSPVLISVIGTFAVVNGALIQIIMASRVIYGMASKGWLPAFFAEVSVKTRTPVQATLFVGGVSIVLSLVFDVVSLASYTSMLILIVFSVVNISLIRIKSSSKTPQGVIQIPLWVPWSGMLLNILLIIIKLLFG
jgi:basic amino acid/polyamine antiporter, APA family